MSDETKIGENKNEKTKSNKTKKIIKIVFIIISAILAVILTIFGSFLIFASSTTLKIKDIESMDVNGNIAKKINKEESLKLLTWNIGYCCLDEKADFYMDGGKGVNGESKENTLNNLNTMINKIEEINPDMFYIQEIDINSKRSFNINQLNSFKERFNQDNYDYDFARNFKAGYIPIPVGEPMGKVESGITTFSKYDINSAERVQLPIPFKWPVKLFNLKRCLLISYLPIEGSDKYLVLINLHLEAYSDGDGKIKQLNMLMDILKEEYEKGNYVIAGGDFNQTFTSINYQQYPNYSDWEVPIINSEDYPLFQFVMDDNNPTCRLLDKPLIDADKNTISYYMIDGFILSNNIKVNSCETLNLEFKNSDHNPVLLNYSLI